MDLDQFFTLGPDLPFRSNPVFTDRESYIAAFHERLVTRMAKPWPVPELLNFQRPAENVVTFIGAGGMGKSTLARHVAQLATDGKLAGVPGNRAYAVIDFADPSSHNFETVLLRLRGALAPLGKAWHAFDIALAVYWERKHPGESLTALLKKSSSGATVSRQLSNGVDELLGGFGVVSLAYHAIDSLGRAGAQASRLKRLRKELPALEPILTEEDPDRMLGYLAVLLSADLERIREKEPTAAICLLDTGEKFQANSGERGGLEDLVSRLVYLMPNVFFVVASRDPLRWHDPVRSVGLTYGGEPRWPGLAGPDQFGLDGFDDANADAYLTSRLTLPSGTPAPGRSSERLRDGKSAAPPGDDAPAIPEPIRRRMIAGAAGSPLYLELSVNLYEQHLAKGEQPEEDMFGKPFPELVLRVMRDMSADERDLFRAAALLEAFDEDVLKTVLPDLRGRQIESFLRKQFVRTDPSVWPPHRMHDNLRRGVIECDEYTSDGWTTDERAERVLRAVEYLAELTCSVLDDLGDSELSLRERSLRSVSAFLLGLRAADEHDVTPDSLTAMAYTLSELGHRQVFASLPELADSPELARLTAVARLTANTELDAYQRYEQTRRVAGDYPAGPFRDYLCFELGNRAHSIGALDAADRYFSAIAESDSPVATGALFGLGGNAMRRSDYRRVEELMAQVRGGGIDRIRVADMLGHMHLHNARFEVAAGLFQSALDDAEQINAPLWSARASRHLAQAYMWRDPQRTLGLIAKARELNQVVGARNGIAQCDMAAAAAHAALGEWPQADTLLADARRRFDEEASRDLLPIDAVEILHLAATGRIDDARARADELAEAEAEGRPAVVPVWVAVTALWTGRPAHTEFASIGWLDDTEVVRERWREPLRRLRENTPG